MDKPDDPKGGDSIWARLEREDREEAKRWRGPMWLCLSGLLLLNVRDLVPTGAVYWVVVGVAVALIVSGVVLAWTRRRKY